MKLKGNNKGFRFGQMIIPVCIQRKHTHTSGCHSIIKLKKKITQNL